MAKAVFGEYAAFTTRGGIRFQKNNLMTSEKAIPPEVVAFLKSKIATEVEPVKTEAPKFPMPTEEEKARLREESLRVPDELKLSPQEEAQRALVGVPDNSAPLTPDDFDEEVTMTPVLTETENAPLADELVLGKGEPVELPALDAALINAMKPGEFTGMQLTRIKSIIEATQPNVDPSFMESVSIHTASLQDIARALYDRFGIYTVYLGKLPVSDEVNPLTGEPFTKYHQGIAYQAALAAESKGLRDPETYRQNIDQGRLASETFQDTFVPAPVTMGDARRADSFAYRTSVGGTKTIPTTEIVHIKDELTGEIKAVQREIPVQENGSVARSRFDSDEDEQIIEPPIFGTKPIIKPNW
jgi:hypothetical protein